MLYGKAITQALKMQRVLNAAAAGQTTLTSSAVDTQGFETCLFLVLYGTITDGGAQSIKVQQSSDDGVADAYADLAATSYAVADSADNKGAYLEILVPTERYLKLIVTRASANAVVDGAVAFLGGGEQAPTHDSTIVGGERHYRPAEGTA